MDEGVSQTDADIVDIKIYLYRAEDVMTVLLKRS